MPVVERPELAWVPLGEFDELSLLVARRVAHWQFSLRRFKREAFEGGYEALELGWAASRGVRCMGNPRLSSQSLKSSHPAPMTTISGACLVPYH